MQHNLHLSTLTIATAEFKREKTQKWYAHSLLLNMTIPKSHLKCHDQLETSKDQDR